MLQRIEYQPLYVLVTQHSIGLAWGRLPIHKYGWMVAFQKLFDHLRTTVVIDFAITLSIFEDMITSKLIDVACLYFTLPTMHAQRWIFVQDDTIVFEGLTARQGGNFIVVLVDAPSLCVFILIEEGPHAYCDFYLFSFLHPPNDNNNL